MCVVISIIESIYMICRPIYHGGACGRIRKLNSGLVVCVCVCVELVVVGGVILFAVSFLPFLVAFWNSSPRFSPSVAFPRLTLTLVLRLHSCSLFLPLVWGGSIVGGTDLIEERDSLYKLLSPRKKELVNIHIRIKAKMSELPANSSTGGGSDETVEHPQNRSPVSYQQQQPQKRDLSDDAIQVESATTSSGRSSMIVTPLRDAKLDEHLILRRQSGAIKIEDVISPVGLASQGKPFKEDAGDTKGSKVYQQSLKRRKIPPPLGGISQQPEVQTAATATAVPGSTTKQHSFSSRPGDPRVQYLGRVPLNSSASNPQAARGRAYPQTASTPYIHQRHRSFGGLPSYPIMATPTFPQMPFNPYQYPHYIEQQQPQQPYPMRTQPPPQAMPMPYPYWGMMPNYYSPIPQDPVISAMPGARRYPYTYEQNIEEEGMYGAEGIDVEGPSGGTSDGSNYNEGNRKSEDDDEEDDDDDEEKELNVQNDEAGSMGQDHGGGVPTTKNESPHEESDLAIEEGAIPTPMFTKFPKSASIRPDADGGKMFGEIKVQSSRFSFEFALKPQESLNKKIFMSICNQIWDESRNRDTP
ncbi:Dig1p KNAG_0A02160 [Huiozyma naganishii CBS 8797]|uniref:Uncharacterized protein n=1 Tax=Huiozyma naganishii (strain ATCC MYA-139 / BCRC 22969 / CBS 8797 / KCTC 17520 / NBRC 10181 / NCYC 3082 / Yp74L-3) TaxID=1071383 RepID=J7QZK0_HUIN7|nr:hypothetical protein KNAG_0A02160 [Kazachstania naganishii CBS 8797]CCK67905.1 hypothetical protein KNAG_0A02160 [Kazachstania naganishii CBS 8797]